MLILYSSYVFSLQKYDEAKTKKGEYMKLKSSRNNLRTLRQHNEKMGEIDTLIQLYSQCR